MVPRHRLRVVSDAATDAFSAIAARPYAHKRVGHMSQDTRQRYRGVVE